MIPLALKEFVTQKNAMPLAFILYTHRTGTSFSMSFTLKGNCMYKRLPGFTHPNNKDILWRYLSFEKFASLLATESPHFARADTFEDPYESLVPPSIMHLYEQEILHLQLYNVIHTGWIRLFVSLVQCILPFGSGISLRVNNAFFPTCTIEDGIAITPKVEGSGTDVARGVISIGVGAAICVCFYQWVHCGT